MGRQERVNTLVTSDTNSKRVNELVENDQIFEKEKSDFIYILPFGNGLRQLFCMDLIIVESKGQL